MKRTTTNSPSTPTERKLTREPASVDGPAGAGDLPEPGTAVVCPICPKAWTVPVPQHAPGLAAVFGISANTLAGIHQGQQLHSLEADIARHMRRHGPDEWLPALMDANRTILAMAAALAEVTR